MPVSHHDSLLLQGFSSVPGYSLAQKQQQQQQQQQQLLQELSAALLVRVPELLVQAGRDRWPCELTEVAPFSLHTFVPEHVLL
jgi:hypothetical protein